MSTIDRATPKSMPMPAGTSSITFTISALFPALAKGSVVLWELRADGGHTEVEGPYDVDTDPATATGNSKSWVVNPTNKYLVWFTGHANILQPGGAITLTTEIKNQNGSQISRLSNEDSPSKTASTVNFSHYLG